MSVPTSSFSDSTESRYLKALTCSRLCPGDVPNRLASEMPKFFTQHPIFHAQIRVARERLGRHFSSINRTRPLNCLVLGPPGSGKSSLALGLTAGTLEGLSKAESESIWKLSFNLSQFGSVNDIGRMFDEITKANAVKSLKPGVVFIDEFDVRIGGVSAIQALISPIYDRDDFSNIAFIFSGSYLKNRKMLGTQLDNALEFDIRRFLAVYRVYTRNREDRKLVAELDDIFWRLEEKEKIDPDQSVLNYLAGLEKLIDFRSRINGFVIEIPDLDAPLDVTENPFGICMPMGENRLTPNPARGDQLLDFIEMREEAGALKVFRRIDEPLFRFKDMLLMERLGRVLYMIRRRCTSASSGVKVERASLNYLATVPVRHGMRSVEYLVSRCTDDKGILTYPAPGHSADMLQLHIRNTEEYPDPKQVWSQIKASNSEYADWDSLSPFAEISCS